MTLKLLPQSTIKLIGSSQVISSVSSAVKELMENSIDAGATNIEIRLENYGLDRIEIKDDGYGISPEDVPFMCQRSYTSKIGDFSDLEKLSSYGFRGEALNSLCAVGKMTVTTKRKTDSIGKIYFLDSDGRVIDSKPSHIVKGTIVVVEGLFRKIPVRRQMLANNRKKNEEIKKTEAVVKCLAIIHPTLRVVLSHNKFCIWQKSKVPTLRQSLIQAIPPTMVNQLHDITYSDEQVKFDLLIPRKDCNIPTLCHGNVADTQYLYVNSRPVRDRVLDKVIQEEIFQFFGHYIPAGKHPMCLVSIHLPGDSLDVNLEPNKTKVLIKDMDELVMKLKNQFITYYVGLMEAPKAAGESLNIKIGGKRKVNEEDDEFVEVPEEETSTKSKLCKMSQTSEETNSQMSELSLDKSSVQPGSEESFSESFDFASGEFTSSQSNEDKNELPRKVASTKDSNSHTSERDLNISKFLEGLPVQTVLDSTSSCGTQTTDITTNDRQQFSGQVKEGQDDKFMISDSDEEMCLMASQKVEQAERKLGSIFKALNSRSSPDEDEIQQDLITLSQWSRGEVVINGKLLKGTNEIRGQAKSDESMDQSVVEITKNCQSEEETVNQSSLKEISKQSPVKSSAISQELERSVSSQMGCKEMSAFTKFARIMRSKLVEQTPGVSFTSVASELALRWQKLQDEDKEKYKEMAKNESKEKEKTRKELETKSKENQTTLKVKPLPRPERSGLKKKTYSKTMNIELSLDKLKALINERCSQDQNSNVRLIGELKEGVVFCKVAQDLGALSVPRLQEALLFFDNLVNMTIPLRVLEENIAVEEFRLGDSLWTILSCMETSIDSCGTVIISDERIRKNGLRIEVIEGLDGNKFQVTDVASHIAFYGLQDLIEILRLVEANGSITKLEECRPLKVISYIRSETIRSLTKSESFQDELNVCDSINYWIENVKGVTQHCPHHNPVLQVIR